ncbi:MAG: hypothetical protein JW839_16840 [Candidatus Lokiarchaeota archaeon]|nr:hypothetical protein [Candidatus Lokiarchaeota archaeon]
MTRFDNVFQMDGVKLLRFITTGLILAAVGLAIILASGSIRTAMTSGTYNLYSAITYENQLNFWSGFISYAEYVERGSQLTQGMNWLFATLLLLRAIGQVAVVFGLILALLGFLGCAFNTQNEDKMRLVCMISGCVIIFVLFMGILGI